MLIRKNQGTVIFSPIACSLKATDTLKRCRQLRDSLVKYTFCFVLFCFCFCFNFCFFVFLIDVTVAFGVALVITIGLKCVLPNSFILGPS